jgi:hypothetical protein
MGQSEIESARRSYATRQRPEGNIQCGWQCPVLPGDVTFSGDLLVLTFFRVNWVEIQ